LIGEGTISEEIFFKNSDKPAESFIEEIRQTGTELPQQRAGALQGKKGCQDLKAVGRSSDAICESAKMITMGVEPVVALSFRKGSGDQECQDHNDRQDHNCRRFDP
jgi:hypothetical protein